MPEKTTTHSRAQDWLHKTKTAKWSTGREATRMGKSGYAPRKAELASMVVEGRRVVEDLIEQYENLVGLRDDLTLRAYERGQEVERLKEQVEAAERVVEAARRVCHEEGWNASPARMRALDRALDAYPASESGQSLGRTNDSTNRGAEVAVPRRASDSEEPRPASTPDAQKGGTDA